MLYIKCIIPWKAYMESMNTQDIGFGQLHWYILYNMLRLDIFSFPCILLQDDVGKGLNIILQFSVGFILRSLCVLTEGHFNPYMTA